MSEVQDLAKTLTQWKQHSKKQISDVLKRMDKMTFENQKDYDTILKPITTFHKEIQSLEDDQIDQEWFEPIIKIKKKVKKSGQILQKKKDTQKPQLQKQVSVQIVYPPELEQNARPSQLKGVNLMYKNFVSNLPEAQNDSRTVDFLLAVNKQVRQLYQDEVSTSKRDKRIDSICSHLAKESSIKAKLQMLQGKKTFKQVAHDEDVAYKDQQTLKQIQENMKLQMKASDTGYYDKMKKDINKGASQECRFCRKKSAYCDDMKQIRAADEPMTRFMKCNNCGKNWRD